MKITINPDNLVKDNTWQEFHKVRAIIENENEEFVISKEGGKYIFPGGKCDSGESNIDAIIREIKEETGLEINKDNLQEVFELETYYKDFYDYRTDSRNKRYTSTIYYYTKCFNNIDYSKMELTNGEKDQGFKIAFVSKDKLLKLLSEDHSSAVNGIFFDEENKAVVDNFLKNLLSD